MTDLSSNKMERRMRSAALLMARGPCIALLFLVMLTFHEIRSFTTRISSSAFLRVSHMEEIGKGRNQKEPSRVCDFVAAQTRRPKTCVFASKKDNDSVQTSDFIPLWARNFLQTFGLVENPDGAVVAEGIGALAERPKQWLDGIFEYYKRYGGVFKICLGPKAFLIVSDPAVARRVLAENAFNYDKGLLAEILEPIMGKGLIPAGFEVWKERRRVLAPGFHKAWLNRMLGVFAECTTPLLETLGAAAEEGREVDLEALYSSCALDIIGRSVFNYDFGSVRAQSPVIDAVYGLMQEAEHRSFTPLPYWKVPFVGDTLVPRQRRFKENCKIIDDTLNQLIEAAVAGRREEDIEALEGRDYAAMEDTSLLRFLVDVRGADVTVRQLRDDLTTLLIAGHETTAALLTWATFCAATHPDCLGKLQQEIDEVLGDRAPTMEDIQRLSYTRDTLAEALRLYPQPPILIRRALGPDTWPRAQNNPEPVRVARGSDIFIMLWNVHRSEAHYGPDAGAFRPGRWAERFANPQLENWAGLNPNPSLLYQNEITTDFAFLPFGAGVRKCIGDQFAFMEAVTVFSMVLRRFTPELAVPPERVGLETGATIHTAAGLPVRLRTRGHKTTKYNDSSAASSFQQQAVL